MSTLQSVTIQLDGEHGSVSGLLQVPEQARACYVFAHGAGAGMDHPFMAAVAQGLFRRGIGTLRYQFPYMERKSKRPDSPALAQATVRAAVKEAGRLLPRAMLFAGGKSFGGRMTSQAQAVSPLPAVRGLVFLGFPLHAANQPSAKRADHLAEVQIPMLFLQGTRDALASQDLLTQVVDQLGSGATLKWYDQADHSFHVPARSGRSDSQVLDEMLDHTAQWMKSLID